MRASTAYACAAASVLVLVTSTAADGAGVRSPLPRVRPAARVRAHRRAPAHMLVYAQEWSLWPSRTTLPSGRVSVQLWNRGEDAHDLRIRRVTRAGHMFGAAQGAPVTQSGAISSAKWTLRPGTYELYCSMPGHLARGMHVLVHVA